MSSRAIIQARDVFTPSERTLLLCKGYAMRLALIVAAASCFVASHNPANAQGQMDPATSRERDEIQFGKMIRSVVIDARPKTLRIPESTGKYLGELVISAYGASRTFKLEKSFSYVDPAGTQWDVPTETLVDGVLKPTILDGASIPRAFWSVIGSPWTGPYVRASVIHDYNCDFRTHAWKDVHRVFYNAMLTSQVDWVTAKVMYFAVYTFGPRWEFEDRDVQVCEAGTPADCQRWSTIKRRVAVDVSPGWFFNFAEVQARSQEAVAQIVETNPSLEEIERLSDERLGRYQRPAQQ
jgi:hypothetical protein